MAKVWSPEGLSRGGPGKMSTWGPKCLWRLPVLRKTWGEQDSVRQVRGHGGPLQARRSMWLPVTS